MSGDIMSEALDGYLATWVELRSKAEGEIAALQFGPACRESEKLVDGLASVFEGWRGGKLDPALGVFHGTSAMQLHAGRLCRTALDLAVEQGVPKAVEWLRKIPEVRNAPGRAIVSFTGLKVEGAADILPGVTLRSATRGHDTPAPTRRHPQSAFAVPATFQLEVALENLPFIGPLADENPGQKAVMDAHRRLEKLGAALAMLGGSSRPHEYWVEFDDADLNLACDDGARMFALREHDRFANATIVANSTSDILTRYEQLQGDDATAMDLALDRLVSARVNLRQGDKALDGAIALEALFLPDGEQELSYRLSLRAAVFLGATLQERRDIVSSIKAFYKLRSKVAHGSVPAETAGGGAASATVARGLELLQAAATKICLEGGRPDWSALELRV